MAELLPLLEAQRKGENGGDSERPKKKKSR